MEGSRDQSQFHRRITKKASKDWFRVYMGSPLSKLPKDNIDHSIRYEPFELNAEGHMVSPQKDLSELTGPEKAARLGNLNPKSMFLSDEQHGAVAATSPW